MRDLTKHEKFVLSNILKELCKCDLFVGKYDATHGSEHFMHGIGTVMESLAYMVSEETGDKFSELFTANLIASEERKGE